jgi:hypothetical protein
MIESRERGKIVGTAQERGEKERGNRSGRKLK